MNDNEEILALHRQLAAERLRADRAETRSDAKSRECIELRERMAAPAAPEQVQAAPAGYKLVPIKPTPEMSSAAIKAAAEFRYNSTGMQGFTHADSYRAMIAAAPSAAAPAAPEQGQWISVDERLPEPETDVLIIRLGQARVGAIFIEHESWEEGGREIHYWDDPNDDGRGWDWCEVTHWMPLPAAPSMKTAINEGEARDE